MVEEDHSKFNAADEDKDGALNEKEYVAFEFPYDFKHMHEVEMDRSMKDYDKNADGTISLQEFLGQGIFIFQTNIFYIIFFIIKETVFV